MRREFWAHCDVGAHDADHLSTLRPADQNATVSQGAPLDDRWAMIELILTVCALSAPDQCLEQRLQFVSQGSLMQCMMQAPPYIAQWVGEHPKWNAVRWRCEYPHSNDKADAGKATPAG